jgi:hypothetical protein
MEVLVVSTWVTEYCPTARRKSKLQRIGFNIFIQYDMFR